MAKDVFTGRVTSINHDKNYVSVVYMHNERKRTITCRMSEADEKPKHIYRVGDEVSFQVKGANRGSSLIAYNLKFLYNNELDQLLLKASVDNRFTGYLKLADDQLFIKERGSYIFFPLEVSKWEKMPAEEQFNEAVEFRLINTEKRGRISAELFHHEFNPEYRKAIQALKNQTPVEATVTRISDYAIYLALYEGKLSSKLPLAKDETTTLQPGDIITVRITHLTLNRIVVERLDT